MKSKAKAHALLTLNFKLLLVEKKKHDEFS